MMVTDVAVRGYLKNLVGEDGLEMVERASINEFQDSSILVEAMRQKLEELRIAFE